MYKPKAILAIEAITGRGVHLVANYQQTVLSYTVRAYGPACRIQGLGSFQGFRVIRDE